MLLGGIKGPVSENPSAINVLKKVLNRSLPEQTELKENLCIKYKQKQKCKNVNDWHNLAANS